MYEKLRKIRNDLGISVSELRQLLGLQTDAAYYKKEKGLVKFSLEEALIISQRFEMGVEDIFLENEVSINDSN
jgi:DNA-binding XRE family transcriptional regulator